jgi:sugar phosphate isomerase/epimerase
MPRKRFGVSVVNGFTGSSIWHLVYSFPPNLPGQIDAGYADFAKRFKPILDEYQKLGIRYALEVHPTEIAFDIASAERALQAIDYHPAFGFNYDPSHFGYQGVDYVKFLYKFSDRIFHVHMKDVSWGIGDGTVGVFGGHVDFHKPSRYWDFKSVGRGKINFELIIRALNDIDYGGPLSVEWEDGAMDREFGATESAAFCQEDRFPAERRSSSTPSSLRRASKVVRTVPVRSVSITQTARNYFRAVFVDWLNLTMCVNFRRHGHPQASHPPTHHREILRHRRTSRLQERVR